MLKREATSIVGAEIRGLPGGVPLEAMVGAAIVATFDHARDPASPLPGVQLKPGDQPGAVNVRIAGRVASGLPKNAGKRIESRFPKIVTMVRMINQFQSAIDAEERLDLVTGQARRVVGSESAIRRALLARESAAWLRTPTGA